MNDPDSNPPPGSGPSQGRPSHPPLKAIVTEGYAIRDPRGVQAISKHQLIYSVGGLVVGLVCIIGGVVLFLHGVTGSTSWTAKILGAESQVSDAAPGAVLFIVGLFVVFATRYVMKVTK